MSNKLFDALKHQKGMELLPEKLAKSIPSLYSQENTKDPICHVKFFCISSNWTWYVIEYSPEEKLFYGYVEGFENELGYFSLDELKSLGANIERDLYFSPTPLSKIKN